MTSRPSTRPSLRSAILAVATVLTVVGMGCSTSNSAKDCPDRAIAFMGPVTGSNGADGRAFRGGIETAMAMAEESGRLTGCPVGLITFDTRADPDRARALATAITEDPQILAVIGPSYSGETAAAMPILEAAGVPVITASATNPELATKGWRSFHRVVVDDATQGPAAAAWMVERLAVRTVAVVDDGSLYGKGLADLVASALGARGVVVAPRLQIEAGRLDYRVAVESIRNLGADAVYFGGVTGPAARLVRQIRNAGVTAPFVSGDAVFQPEFISLAGSAAAGVVVTCPCTIGGGTSAAAREFAAAYQRITGTAPSGYSAEYADATRLVLDAITAGARSRGQVERSLDAVDVDGITKRLSFDSAGQIRSGPVFVFEVVDAAFAPIATVERGIVTPTTGN